MTEMVERVARAICEQLFGPFVSSELPASTSPSSQAVLAAIAAIAALRPEFEAAKAEIQWWSSEHGCCAGRDEEAAALAMIDEALK